MRYDATPIHLKRSNFEIAHIGRAHGAPGKDAAANVHRSITQPMTPFMFGEPSRRLFGIFHPGIADMSAGAVLMCNPFGQEAIRSHRMLRVLAQRLARAGFDVLRFDYFGTGDSAGDDEDGDLAGWVRDVLAAHHELQRRTVASRLAWVGARLGASIAMLTQSQAQSQAQAARVKLVVWDPIIDGGAYLGLLRIKHVEALEGSYSLPDASWRRRLRDDPSAFTQEAIGFGMSPALRRQVAEMNSSSFTFAPGSEVHVIARPDDVPVNAWLSELTRQDLAVRHWPLAHSFDWTAAEAMNTSLVPAAAFDRLMTSICE